MNRDDRVWRRYVEDFRRNGLSKIVGSAVCLQLYGGGGSDFDVKQATELGAMLLLDKPILLVLAPGARLPTRLAKAADVVIEDWNPDDPESGARLAEAARRLAGGST